MKIGQIAILITASLLVAGVGTYIVMNQSGGTDNRDEKKIPDSEYYPVTIKTLASGIEYEQTFNEAPKRVVVMFNTNIELFCYFGIEDRIVAASGDSDYKTLFKEHQSAYNAIKKTPNLMNAELIRSLDPDLIVAWSSTFTDSRLGTVPLWNGYGANCVITNRPSVSVDDYIRMLENIGTIFNMKDVAEKKIATFESAYKDVEKRTSGLSADKKVKALMLEPGYETGCYAYGASFLSGDLITKAGGVNLFGGGMEMLTFEKIASYNPDIIFIVPDFSSPTIASVEVSVKEFKAIPGFASMTDNVVGFEFYELYMGGLFPDDIIKRLFEAMYPD